jgi:hypothetical protein
MNSVDTILVSRDTVPLIVVMHSLIIYLERIAVLLLGLEQELFLILNTSSQSFNPLI